MFSAFWHVITCGDSNAMGNPETLKFISNAETQLSRNSAQPYIADGGEEIVEKQCSWGGAAGSRLRERVPEAVRERPHMEKINNTDSTNAGNEWFLRGLCAVSLS